MPRLRSLTVVMSALCLVSVACSSDTVLVTSQATTTTRTVEVAPPTTVTATTVGEPQLSTIADVVGSDVVIEVEASGFEIRYVEGDVSGKTAHVHAYVDRSPPASGDNVPLGDPSIVHSTGSTITVRGLGSGVHRIWVIAADGNDDALVPPEPAELTVTVP